MYILPCNGYQDEARNAFYRPLATENHVQIPLFIGIGEPDANRTVLCKVNILQWLPLDSSEIKVDKQGKLVGKLKIFQINALVHLYMKCIMTVRLRC